MNNLTWVPRVAQLLVGACYLLAVTYAWADSGRLWQVAPFDRIYVQGNATVHLKSSAEREVHATGRAASVAGVVVEVMDGALYIDARESSQASHLQIQIDVQQLKEVVFDGQGLVAANHLRSPALVLEGVGEGAFELRNLDVHQLVVVGTGRSIFRLSGQAQNQSIDIAGNGEYLGGDLRSSISQVSVRGHGDVALWADEVLDVNVFGSAKVKYTGDPRVHRRIVGHGAVSHVPHNRATAL